MVRLSCRRHSLVFSISRQTFRQTTACLPTTERYGYVPLLFPNCFSPLRIAGVPVGWFTLLKTKNIKAIVAYEPGGSVPFPTGQVPEEGKVLTRSKKTEGIEVPMAVFKRYMEIPIIIYYGDNLPETDEHPELYEWTRRLHLMRKWAEMLNKLGGDVTVIHLPDVGLHGNTHFPMSDLNNVEVADLLSKWLYEKQLDR